MRTGGYLVLALSLALGCFGCNDDAPSTGVNPSNPLTGRWIARSIHLDVRTENAPCQPELPAWRQHLVDSGLLTLFGTAVLEFTDHEFDLQASLHSTLRPLVPGLAGHAAGMYVLTLPQNAINFEVHSWSPPKMFDSRAGPPTAVGFASFSGNQMSLEISIPRHEYCGDWYHYYRIDFLEVYTLVWERID